MCTCFSLHTGRSWVAKMGPGIKLCYLCIANDSLLIVESKSLKLGSMVTAIEVSDLNRAEAHESVRVWQPFSVSLLLAAGLVVAAFKNLPLQPLLLPADRVHCAV